MSEKEPISETENIIYPKGKMLKLLPKFGSNKNPKLISFNLPRRINYDDINKN